MPASLQVCWQRPWGAGSGPVEGRAWNPILRVGPDEGPGWVYTGGCFGKGDAARARADPLVA